MAKVHFTRFPGAEHERAVKLKPRTMRMNGETRCCEWSCRGGGQRIFQFVAVGFGLQSMRSTVTGGRCKQYTAHVTFSCVFQARVHITLAQVVPCLKKVVSSPRHPHVSYAPVVWFSLGYISFLLVTLQRGQWPTATCTSYTRWSFETKPGCSRAREPSR